MENKKEETTLAFAEGKKYYLWTKENMPDTQAKQLAATTEEINEPGFNPDDNRIPHIQWFREPDKDIKTDACMIIISGGGYSCCCDMPAFAPFVAKLLAAGINCVNFTYRTPRPDGIPIYKTAWDDGQRAVRLVRSQAAERGFSPDKIGVVGCSAGSHLCMLLALSSKTPSYKPVDQLDEIPCNIAWSVPMCPAYVLSDGMEDANERGGLGDDIAIDDVFEFDEQSCPCCFMHGGNDQYSPIASVRAYQRLRRMGISAELHIEAKAGHGFANYHYMDTPQVTIDFLKRIGAIPAVPAPLFSHSSAKDDLAATLKWEKDKIAKCQGDLDLII